MGVFLLCTCLPGMTPEQAKPSVMDQAVQEFKIRTRSLGLRANSPRKLQRKRSGAASWHGRLFWNFRNDTLDAVPHEVTQTEGTKGILRRNQYGFNISGPVVIPKLFYGGTATFFSLSYEGMRETIGRSYLTTIPTMAERTGDFSRVVDNAGQPLPIYDPASTHPNPNFDPGQNVSVDNLQYIRQPFPGNRIPAARLDPVALDAMQYYSAPNINIGPFFQNNYSIYAPEINTANGMRGKLDHAIRDRHRFTFSFSYSNGHTGPAMLFPTIANPGGPPRDFRSRSLSVQHTFTMSPNNINTFRAGAWRSSSENVSELGRQGRPFPVYRFSPYLSMGRSFPVSRNASTSYGISDTLATRHGKHSLRFHTQWSWRQVNSFWPRYPSGRFNFSSGLTSLPGIVNTGHAFSSFMLGLSDFAEADRILDPSYFRRKLGKFGFRDEWELREGLTVYPGVNFTVDTPRIEKYDRQSTVDFGAINPANGRLGALVFAGRNGQGRAFQPVRIRPEPRLSVVWSPFADAKTVMRVSLRRNYGHIPLYSGQWGTQGFNGTPTYITQNVQLEPAVVLRKGLPEPPYPVPDLRPEAANDTIADLIDPTSRQPTYDSVRVSIQRQFPSSFMLTVGGNYTRGRNMLANNNGANPNAIPLDDLVYRDLLNDETFNRSHRPYPQYQGFNVYSQYPVGHYQRTEGYLRVEKRTSQGLSLRAVYEFSKQMDDYVSRNGLQDYYHRRKEWAPTFYSDPRRLSLTYMYELPFGPNKHFLTANNWKRFLVAGWAISGMTSYSSGAPLTLRAEFNNTGKVVRALYVNAVPGVDPHAKNKSPEQWFNPAAFVNPPDFTIGNISRSYAGILNPIRQKHDLSVTKRISLAADGAVELTANMFNFINHANWNRPDTGIGTVAAPNVNAGRIIGSRGGRVVQLGLRFTF